MSTIVNLKEVSENDLRTELARRQEEREKARIAAIEVKNELILKHLDVLLEFVEHSRTSCSDETPINDERCQRCLLINAKHMGYISPETDVNFYITNR
jgi:hypothetical protein